MAQSTELTASQSDRVNEIYEQAFAPHYRVPFAQLAATGPAALASIGRGGAGRT